MRRKKKQANNRHNRRITSRSNATQAKQPFVEHAQELRRRVYHIALSILVVGTGIYFVQQHIVAILLRPSHGQHFIYTSVGGGIDFLFKVCAYGGIVISTPVIVYNVLGFLEPLLSSSSRRFITFISIISSLLAVAGVVFGYFVGLPAALHFLLHQFRTVQIQPLVTIQAYLNFVMAYIFGSALLFQLPIILICINRIKPLNPRRLFHYERWVILAAFVLSGLMNPTPNLISQLLIAGPFIIMYQLGIGVIAIVNRPKRPAAVREMFEQDLAVQAQRQALVSTAVPVKAEPVPPQPATSVNLSKPAAVTNLQPRARSLAQAPQRTPLYPATRPAPTRRIIDFMPRPNTLAEEQ